MSPCMQAGLRWAMELEPELEPIQLTISQYLLQYLPAWGYGLRAGIQSTQPPTTHCLPTDTF